MKYPPRLQGLRVLVLLFLLACASAAVAARAFAVPPRRPQGMAELRSVASLRRYLGALRARGRRVPGYLQAYEFWLRQRAFPRDTIDWSAYARAYAQRDRMVRPRTQIRAQAVPQWEFVGPSNLHPPYRVYFGPGRLSGRVNAVAFSPTAAGTYFLGAAGGGFWKSTDSGHTWSCLSDAWTNARVSSVAVHPANGQIVYVGTGDFDGGYSSYGFGLMKSTDGGSTWMNLGAAEFAGFSIRSILVDPEMPNIVTVTTGRHPTRPGRVWRSTDGGGTWDVVIEADADYADLVCGAPDAGGRRYYYAAGLADGGSVWRSGDRGATWTRLTLPLSGGFQGALEIAASPLRPETVYLLSGTDRKILKSTDAGVNWTNVTANFPNGPPNDPFYNWSQNAYDFHITCSRRPDTNQDVVYVGLIDLVASTDGGATWTSAGLSYTDIALTHNDQHCLAVNPHDPNELLIGNDGGVYRATFTPSSTSWAFEDTLSTTLGISQFYGAAFHPADPTRMLGGTQDNATPVAAGDLLDWQAQGGGDGGQAVIHPTRPGIQYCTAQGGSLYRTGDEWAHSAVISHGYGGDTVAFVAPVAIAPSAPKYVYVGTNHLWRWDDSRSKWTARLGRKRLSGAGGYLTAVAVSPRDSRRIYTGSSDGQVWMTGDGGSSWRRIDRGSPSVPRRAVSCLAVNPTQPNVLLVGLSGTGASHLWRCGNTSAGKRKWVNASGSVSPLPDSPLDAVAIDPGRPDRGYWVGTDVGAFYTEDAGVTWTNGTEPLGLPNVQVNDLEFVPGTGYLMAATFGRGMWRLRLPLP